MNEPRVSSRLQCPATQREFRRTPVRKQLLQLVRDGRIEWRDNIGPFGGFAPVGGAHFPPGNGLVALYELRNAELIKVDLDSGRVFVTAAGLVHLDEWEGRRAERTLYLAASHGD